MTRDGKTQEMSPHEAGLRKAYEKAVTAGDLRSIKFLIRQFEKYRVLEARPASESGGVWIAPRWAKLEEVARLMKAGDPAPRIRQDPNDPQGTIITYE